MRATLPCQLLCFVSALALDAVPLPAQEAARFRMEGVVLEVGTGRPVPDATVQVLIQSERRAEQRIRSAKTDANGRYSVALPVGHGWAWNMQPPAGYSPARAQDLEEFATTIDQPVFRKDYEVRNGIAWHVVVNVPAAAMPLGQTYFALGQRRENEYFSAYCEVGDDGRCAVTIPSDASGEFKVQCGDLRRTLVAPDDMKLVVAKGFRNDRVTSLNQLPHGDCELRDSEGRIATLHGARAEIKDGTASLVVELKPRSAAESALIVGRVVDGHNQPIAGAEVEAAFHSGGGSATSLLTAESQADGMFRLVIPKPSDGGRVSLVVTKEGYAGIDTEPRSLDLAKSQESDFGSIKLRPGCSIRVRVVGPQGQPLQGAIVDPSRNYAAHAQIARTGAEGMCTLKNLAEGVEAVFARFGTLTTSTKLPLVEGENEPIVLKLSPPPVQTADASRVPVKALKAGAQAPEWDIADWTDGQARKLADLRGKVVLLDFWGVWCGPCISSIPAMKQLHEKYAERGVVFLGIHTAGTDITLVKRLLKQQEWQTVTGLDVGDDIVSGKTVQAFAIQGFPTVVIVDRQGKVAYNSGDVPSDREKFMKEMEKFVKEAGLPWPLDEGVTKEVLQERLTKLNVVLYSREIDRALEAPAK